MGQKKNREGSPFILKLFEKNHDFPWITTYEHRRGKKSTWLRGRESNQHVIIKVFKHISAITPQRPHLARRLKNNDVGSPYQILRLCKSVHDWELYCLLLLVPEGLGGHR